MAHIVRCGLPNKFAWEQSWRYPANLLCPHKPTCLHGASGRVRRILRVVGLWRRKNQIYEERNFLQLIPFFPFFSYPPIARLGHVMGSLRRHFAAQWNVVVP